MATINFIFFCLFGFFVFSDIGNEFWKYDYIEWLLAGTVFYLFANFIMLCYLPIPAQDDSLIGLWLKVRKKKLREQLKDD